MNQKKMSIQEQTFNLLVDTNTEWSVEKKPLISNDGLITDSFGVFRKDNNKHLGTVKKQYKVYQNSSLAQTIIEASQGLTNEYRGGFLDDGKKIYYQLKLSSAYVNNDTVKRYITAVNSHDGSTAISFGSSNKVISCKNTFYKVHKELKKVRHTSRSSELIQAMKNDLMYAIKIDNSLMENYKRMADVKLTKKKVFEDIFSKLFNVDLNSNISDHSTRKNNMLKTFNEAIESEISNKGQTLWGLFNGVTFFTNHLSNVKAENLQNNLMFGSGYRMNNDAYDIVLKEIELTKMYSFN